MAVETGREAVEEMETVGEALMEVWTEEETMKKERRSV